MLVDTHAHLDFLPAGRQGTDDAKGWLARAREAGVGKIICVGTSIEASRKCVEIARGNPDSRFRIKLASSSTRLRRGSPQATRRSGSGMTKERNLQIFATVGIHPQDGQSDIKKFGSLERCIDELRKLVKSTSKVVAVGECGLDYYNVTSNTQSSFVRQSRTTEGKQATGDKEKRFQGELFEAQVRLAADLKLPLIIHCRNGWKEIFNLLTMNHERSTINGVFHSWTGDFVAAKKALDLGFYISFSGIVTFKNAPNVQEVAKKIPLSRMLVETDSPFLSPHPYRGMKNEPKNVRITAQFIADLRGEGFDKIAEATSGNAGRLFGI